MSIFFDDYNVSKTMFQRNIDSFEETVSSSQEVKEEYVTIQDSSDNSLSLLFKTISDTCVGVIQFIALIFSDFISTLLTIIII
ncbi:MAG: hypothetical protein RR585_02980 [Coprobacillus sp.]